MASIGSTSGHQEGQLPDAPTGLYQRADARQARGCPLVEPMLAIGLLPSEMVL